MRILIIKKKLSVIIFYYSSEVTPTGSKMGSIFSDQNHTGGTLTEGDDSGFCKSITSMTSSASSLVMLRPSPKFQLKGILQHIIITIINYITLASTR